MQIVESNQVDVFALAVSREFQQFGDAWETRFSCQLWSNVRHAERLDRIDFDFTIVHAVPGADPDMGAGPEPNAALDLSATDSFAKPLCEDHGESLHPAGMERLIGWL